MVFNSEQFVYFFTELLHVIKMFWVLLQVAYISYWNICIDFQNNIFSWEDSASGAHAPTLLEGVGSALHCKGAARQSAKLAVASRSELAVS